jgi:TolA-binding protein
MKIDFRANRQGHDRRHPALYATAAAVVCFALVSCTNIMETVQGSRSEQVTRTTPANFEVALKENQMALAAGKISLDKALYNAGCLLAHPANPKKDYAKAIHSFHTLVAEHPRSSLLEPAKTWIQVLEQQQKVAEERRKLAEEKRALDREREMLSQERQRLNYATEKSRQLDLEIEKRRRQTLGK